MEWTPRYSAGSQFRTGREALTALIGAVVPRRIWLRAFYGGEVATAVIGPAAKIAAETHNVGPDSELEPDISLLNNSVADSNVVVVVDCFG